MPSEPGSPEPCPECGRPISPTGGGHRLDCTQNHLLTRLKTVNRTPDLTPEERERIADGEPYCFRCGKPASSFREYAPHDTAMRAEMVRQDEGTYNPATNRFACDACYITISMPTGPLPEGWKAP